MRGHIGLGDLLGAFLKLEQCLSFDWFVVAFKDFKVFIIKHHKVSCSCACISACLINVLNAGYASILQYLFAFVTFANFARYSPS